MVTVTFSSAVRTATSGERRREVEFHGTVAQLLVQLREHYGQEFRDRIFDNEQPRPYINFYLNGEDIRYLDNFNTEVGGTDVLDLIPAVAGG